MIPSAEEFLTNGSSPVSYTHLPDFGAYRSWDRVVLLIVGHDGDDVVRRLNERIDHGIVGACSAVYQYYVFSRHTFVSVSYTHLDVYKRQKYYNTISADGRTRDRVIF